jgi:Tfp pilus assembly protein PilF
MKHREGLSEKYAALAVCVFLLLAVALVFGQTARHDFVNFDDNEYVYDNPHVKQGLTLSNVAWAFNVGHAYNWHPLTWFSHMLDARLYGMHPGGHHLTSVLLHAIAAILLFLALWRMTGCLWRSAFVAAVFAVHPLRAESVAWVSERKDVLSGLFFMLTLGAYVGYVRRPFSLARYLAVLVLFGLGLMSKPMLVTLPFVLLLLDYWPLGRMEPAVGGTAPFPGKIILEKLPLLALTAASCAITFVAQSKLVIPVDAVSLSSRMANTVVAYMAYIGKLFYPVGLAVLYPYPDRGLQFWQVAASALALTGISAAAVIWRRRFPWLFVGWFWYLGMMVPVIGLVRVGLHSMADRYTYLPQIGLCLCVTWGVSQMTASWRYRRRVCGIAAALAILLLMGLAWRQTYYWRNSETIWNHTLESTTRNYIAHNSLGVLLADRGEVDAAVVHYREALAIQPDFAEAHNNLGIVLSERGQIDEAIVHYQKALKINPYDARTHLNMGMVLSSHGRAGEAVVYYRTALGIKPDNIKALNNLSWILATSSLETLRNGVEAVELARRAVQLSGGEDPALLDTLAAAYAETGRFAEALETVQRALPLAAKQGDSALVDALRTRIVLYQAGRPYRESRPQQ